jgi:(1->4)-alpha-D-glucan 1-alpha-D-glucosylmutase
VFRATYRVQLHAGFTFHDAAAIVPYLARLGISHLYCSPVLQAAPGSMHGYDVVDHARLNDELGGASGFEHLARALAEHDLSLILDIVPNHMALAGAANRWWWDVLEAGPASPYAGHFDIDWGTSASVLAPILGDHYGRVLEAGGFRLARVGGSFTVRYEDHELPLSLPSVRGVVRGAAERASSTELEAVADAIDGSDAAARELVRQQLRALAVGSAEVADALDAELAAVEADPDAMHALLLDQSYRLAHWRTASEELDYRRFFDVTSLVGLRAEDPQVFDDTHALVLDLVDAGHASGLRVDHVDGLRDPAGYLERLAAAAPGATVLVEKILASDESLPPTWPVAGTTGYDFLARVGDLFVDEERLADLDARYAGLVGDPRPFVDLAADTKAHVTTHELAAETERLTDLLVRVCASRRRHLDHTRRDLRDALCAVAVAMDVYRTYVDADGAAASDRERIGRAMTTVRDRHPDIDGELLELVERILVGDEPGDVETELARRFQQYSAPVMAKGVEDTAFYRHTRLLSSNEVGADPGAAGRGVAPFHAHNEHIASNWPASMLTVSTHDTKRSADVRARLALLSEIPEPWMSAVQRWMAHDDRHRCEGWPDPPTELALYQSLVGAWPLDADRLEAAMVKSVNEAKVHTSWRDRDERYEAAIVCFVRRVLDDPDLLGQVEAFLQEHDLVRLGRLTSLAQVTLLLTSPGVPDLYQGDELWDLSLVDPDNRRPVDFEARAATLERLDAAGPAAAMADLASGGAKLWLIHRLLEHRRARPDLYAGGYGALEAQGAAARHVVAFTRGDLTVVVPRLLVGLERSGWGDTEIALPAGCWRSVLTDVAPRHGSVALAELLAEAPVAVLERERP